MFPPPNLKFSPSQIEIIKCRDPRQIICAGRGFSKTFTAANAQILHALELYDQRVRVDYPRPGHLVKCAHIAPIEKNMHDVFNTAVSEIEQAFDSTDYIVSKNRECRFVLIAPGIAKRKATNKERAIYIMYTSGFNVNAIRGWDLDDVNLDEFAYFGQRVSGGRPIRIANPSDGKNYLESCVMPCITRPYTNGLIRILSTPNYGNYFDRMASNAMLKTGQYGKWRLFHYTYLDNPFLTQSQRDEIGELEEYAPTKYRVEYMAELNVIFKDDSRTEERAFSDDLLEKCLVGSADLSHEPRYALAVDIAWRGKDKCVFAIIDTNNRLLVHMHIYDSTDAEFIVQKILELKNTFSISSKCIAIDATGKGKSIVGMFNQSLSRSIKQIEFNGRTKPAMYDNLCIRLGADLRIPDSDAFPIHVLPHCNTFADQDQRQNLDLLKRQMYDFYKEEYPKIVGGAEIYVAKWIQSPIYGDDCCDALAMCASFLPPLLQKAQESSRRSGNISLF